MFAHFTVQRPVTVIMIFAALCLFGTISFFNLQMDLLPPIQYPEISVITLYPGASPSEIEQLITKPIEEAVNSVPGILRLRSESIEGASLVVATLQWGSDLDFALLKTREKVDLIKGILPQDVYKPIVTRFDPNSLPVMIIAITSKKLDPKALRYEVEKNIAPLFERIDGIGNAKVTGGRVRQIEVLVNRDAMQGYAVSFQEIVNAIQSSHYNYPAGTIITGNKELIIRTVGEFKSLADIENVCIKTTKEGKPVFLKYVATVTDGFKDITSQSFINGAECINLSLIKESGKNTVKVCAKALELVSQLNKKYKHVTLDVVYDGSDYIKQAISNVISSALYGSIIAFIVLLVFLHNLVSSIVIIIAIPVSLCITVLFLNLQGISVNMMSLGGMTICVGMLIDCGIVIIEAVNQTKDHKKASFYEHIKRTILHVSPSLLSSTLTSVVIFLPLILIKGIAGALFTQLAITVTVALVTSYAVSVMLIPAIIILLQNHKKKLSHSSILHKRFSFIAQSVQRFMISMSQQYTILLRLMQSSSKAILFVVLTLLAGCISLLILDKSLMPQTRQKQFFIRVEMPRGTPLAQTVDFMLYMDSLLAKNDHIVKRLINAGYNPDDYTEYFGKDKNTNIGEMTIILDDDADAQSTIQWIQRNLKHPKDITVEYNAQNPELSHILHLAPTNITFDCIGESIPHIEQSIETFLTHNPSIPGISNIFVDAKKGKPEIIINADASKLASFGLTLLDIASTLHTAIYGTQAGKYFEQDNEIDIKVRLDSSFKDSIEDIQFIPLVTQQGAFIPIHDVASIQQQAGFASITRKNQQRYISLHFFTEDGYSANTAIKNIQEKWESTVQSLQATLSIAPEIQEIDRSIHTLVAILILSVVLIYMIIASQFESFLIPLFVMSSIPVSLCGSCVFLLLTGKSINIMSLMGSVILIGTIVNNAILLIDTIMKQLPHAKDILSAIQHACVTRFLPIIMTSLTTVCGLLPLALGFQQGSDLQSPLAISIIGGMLAGTAYIMLVYPSLIYMWLKRNQ